VPPSPTATAAAAAALGPLFETPGSGGIEWSAVLPILIAIPAIILLLIRLFGRGPFPIALSAAGLFLPVAAYAVASLYVLEGSRKPSFCGSCHLMTPLLASIQSNDGSLASTHYARGLVPHEQACYTCHSGYGIWGGVDAKMAGVMHMIRTVTGRYELPLKTHGPFDIDSCLGCHAEASAFRAVEAHQDPDLQKQLLSHELSCTGLCHPAAHPESALNGPVPVS
jgi:hypothetical protein